MTSTGRDHPDVAPDFKKLARRLSFGAPLDVTRMDAKLVEFLAQNRVRHHGQLIDLDEAANPPGHPPEMRRNWYFIYHSLNWVDPLRREYLRTGDETLKSAAIKHIRDWLDRYAGINHRIEPRKTFLDFAWHDMATGWRTMVIGAVGGVTGPEPWLVAALERHLEVLLDEKTFTALNNHGQHQCQGMGVAAMLLGRADAIPVWNRRIEDLYHASFDDQAVNLEGAPAYHRSALPWWSDTKKLGEIIAERYPAYPVKFGDTRPFLSDCIAHDGIFVPVGDTSIGKLPRNYRHMDREKQGRRYIDGLAPENDPGRVIAKPRRRLAAYDEGYLFSKFERPKGRHSMASLRFGRGLPSRPHAHQDAGSVTFYGAGARWIEDAGMYIYQGGRFRNFCRLQKAHNVLIADGADYDGDVTNRLVRAWGEHDANAAIVEIAAVGGCDWRRTLFHIGDLPALIVHDRVVNHNGGPAHLQWNLAAAVEQTDVHADRVELQSQGSTATMLWVGDPAERALRRGEGADPELPLSAMAGWQIFNKNDPRPACSYLLSFAQPVFQSAMLFMAGTNGPKAARIERFVIHGGEIVLEFTRDGETVERHYPLSEELTKKARPKKPLQE